MKSSRKSIGAHIKKKKELFQEIDNLWSNHKDRDTTRECRTFFNYLSKKSPRKSILNKGSLIGLLKAFHNAFGSNRKNEQENLANNV